MIYILHGDNEAASRNTILNLQKKVGAESKQEVRYSDITPEHLATIASNFDFFGNAPFIVIDISNYGRTKLDPFITPLKMVPEQSTIVIYNDKALSSTNIFIKESKNLKAMVLQSTAIPAANVFKLCDYILGGYKQKAYTELKNLGYEADTFQIMGALIFNIRAIALIKFDSALAKSIAPFVKGKAEKYAERYSEEQIIKMYEHLYKTDVELKTGAIPAELALTVLIEAFFSISNN